MDVFCGMCGNASSPRRCGISDVLTDLRATLCASVSLTKYFKYRMKRRRGDFSCERSPLLSDFSKTWVRHQATATCYLGLSEPCEHDPQHPNTSAALFPVRASSVPSGPPGRPSFPKTLSCLIASRAPFPRPSTVLRPLSPLEDRSSVDLDTTLILF